METNLVMEGLKFLALGMGTVFLFLIILIFLMNVMSYIIHSFFPEPKPSTSATQATAKKNNKIIAAITAAISHHRQS